MLEEIISGNSKLRTGLASGTLKNEHSLGLMRSYLDSLGITQADLERLRVIQVAGSKGKGSTCGYLERLFGASGKRTGLFTSPHLVSPRERIRVNGQDISQADFASSFFHVHDTLTAAGIRLPGFFPFLTLMAFYTFTQLALDVAIIEVGIGGRFDSTNIVDRPSVAVITSLALEHTNMLGNSIDQIAWHKSGIIKGNSIAITAKQDPIATSKIMEESQVKSANLTVVTESLGTLDWPESENAALALAAFQQWHTLHGEPMVLNRSTAESILTTTKIPGRKQIVRDNLGVTWFLDGAHTVESLQTVADWLIKVCNPKESTLLFFCGPDRDWDRLYSTITHLNFQKVLFLYPEAYRHLYESSQRSFREIPVTSLVEWLENSGIETKSVVVTGSFYIVGDVLRYLQTQQ